MQKVATALRTRQTRTGVGGGGEKNQHDVIQIRNHICHWLTNHHRTSIILEWHPTQQHLYFCFSSSFTLTHIHPLTLSKWWIRDKSYPCKSPLSLTADAVMPGEKRRFLDSELTQSLTLSLQMPLLPPAQYKQWPKTLGIKAMARSLNRDSC